MQYSYIRQVQLRTNSKGLPKETVNICCCEISSAMKIKAPKQVCQSFRRVFVFKSQHKVQKAFKVHLTSISTTHFSTADMFIKHCRSKSLPWLAHYKDKTTNFFEMCITSGDTKDGQHKLNRYGKFQCYIGSVYRMDPIKVINKGTGPELGDYK